LSRKAAGSDAPPSTSPYSLPDVNVNVPELSSTCGLVSVAGALSVAVPTALAANVVVPEPENPPPPVIDSASVIVRSPAWNPPDIVRSATTLSVDPLIVKVPPLTVSEPARFVAATVTSDPLTMLVPVPEHTTSDTVGTPDGDQFAPVANDPPLAPTHVLVHAAKDPAPDEPDTTRPVVAAAMTATRANEVSTARPVRRADHAPLLTVLLRVPGRTKRSAYSAHMIRSPAQHWDSRLAYTSDGSTARAQSSQPPAATDTISKS
jgi:hypothetical protein